LGVLPSLRRIRDAVAAKMGPPQSPSASSQSPDAWHVDRESDPLRSTQGEWAVEACRARTSADGPHL